MVFVNQDLDWVVLYDMRNYETNPVARGWTIRRGNLARPRQSQTVDSAQLAGLEEGGAWKLMRRANGTIETFAWGRTTSTGPVRYFFRQSVDEGVTWKSLDLSPVLAQYPSSKPIRGEWLESIGAYVIIMVTPISGTAHSSLKMLVLESDLTVRGALDIGERHSTFRFYSSCASDDSRYMFLPGFYPFSPPGVPVSPDLELWRIEFKNGVPVRHMTKNLERSGSVQVYAGRCVVDNHQKLWITPTAAFLDSSRDYGEILRMNFEFEEETVFADTRQLLPGEHFGYFESVEFNSSRERFSVSGYFLDKSASDRRVGLSVVFNDQGEVERVKTLKGDQFYDGYHLWFTTFVPSSADRLVGLGYGQKSGPHHGVVLEF